MQLATERLGILGNTSQSCRTVTVRIVSICVVDGSSPYFHFTRIFTLMLDVIRCQKASRVASDH